MAKRRKTLTLIIALQILLHVATLGQTDSTLYGITRNSSTQEIYLSKLDPANGQVANVSPVAFSSGYVLNALATIDAYQGTFYLRSANKLFGINLHSGSVIIDTTLTTPFPSYFDLMQFNCRDSTLYGITRDSLTQGLYLAKVDPMTGLVSTISPFAFSFGYSMNALATIDPVQSVFYLYSASKLLGIELHSGNLVIDTILTTPFPAYFDLMQFDSQNSTLYGITRNSSTQELYLSKADPMNGQVTIISPVPFSSGYVMNAIATIDVYQEIFYLQSATRLFGLDLNSGSVVRDSTLTMPFPAYFDLMRFSFYDPICKIDLLTSNYSIPNTFTPNNDGVNDFFVIESKGIKELKGRIYNRWGAKIAELNDVTSSWNGYSQNGTESNDGIYYYVISIKANDNREFTEKGFIRLFR